MFLLDGHVYNFIIFLDLWIMGSCFPKTTLIAVSENRDVMWIFMYLFWLDLIIYGAISRKKENMNFVIAWNWYYIFLVCLEICKFPVWSQIHGFWSESTISMSMIWWFCWWLRWRPTKREKAIFSVGTFARHPQLCQPSTNYS